MWKILYYQLFDWLQYQETCLVYSQPIFLSQLYNNWEISLPLSNFNFEFSSLNRQVRSHVIYTVLFRKIYFYHYLCNDF